MSGSQILQSRSEQFRTMQETGALKILFVTFLIVAFLIIVNFLINRYKKSASYAGVDKANFIGLGAYTTKQYFFSYNELEFYNLVSRLLLEESFWKYDIFPKVRLLDLANPNSRFYKNKIAQKHIDFLIVDRTQHCTPILAIELNGHSHETQKMEERDEFVGEFFEIIQIPLLTIQNDELKNPDKVVEKIKMIIS